MVFVPKPLTVQLSFPVFPGKRSNSKQLSLWSRIQYDIEAQFATGSNLFSAMIRTSLFLCSLVSYVIYATRAPNTDNCGNNSQCSKPQVLLWQNLHATAVQKISLVVFPLGSIENHGPHLPLGTDLLLAEAIVTSALAGIGTDRVASLPPSPFGASFEHQNKVGTIAVQDLHLNGLWGDILSSVARTGVKKVLLVNAHGGQSPNVELVVRRFRFLHNALAVSFNLQAAFAQTWALVETRTQLLQTESVYGIHGGLIETSIMEHLLPHLVNRTNIHHFKPRRNFDGHHVEPHGPVVSYGWRSEDICQDGAVGDAASATPELGAAIFSGVVQKLRNVILEILETEIEEIISRNDK